LLIILPGYTLNGRATARLFLARRFIPGERTMPTNTSPPAFLREQPDGVLLAIKLQPRASANEIAEPLGNELRIKVTAPPVDAAANEALVRLLADTLDCPRNRVELVRGHTSRHKTIKLHGLSTAEVVAKLGPFVR
jgi:uncharacterized protein (TIGR00251 family)